jgi:hypothetical protein
MDEWRGLIHKPTCDNPNAAAQKAFRDFRRTTRRIIIIRPEVMAAIHSSVEQIRARRAEQNVQKLSSSRDKRNAARDAASPLPALSTEDLSDINSTISRFSDILAGEEERDLLAGLLCDSYRSASKPDAIEHKALRKFLRELNARRRRR